MYTSINSSSSTANKSARDANGQDKRAPRTMPRVTCLAVVVYALIACLVSFALIVAQVEAGKGKGGEEDIIMYGGNIVLRGDKKGGSIIFAPNNPSNEEVEFSPSFFGDMMGGGFRRRR